MKGQIKLRREVLNALNDYLDHLKSDYVNWANRNDTMSSVIKDQMIKDYNESLTLKKDKIYTRIVVRGSTHSFIMMQDFGRFKRGDILRAAKSTKPDTDFCHGNVLEKKYEKITWSGV